MKSRSYELTSYLYNDIRCVVDLGKRSKYHTTLTRNTLSSYNPDTIKPVLRPLSDIYSTINHKGIKFCPIKELTGETSEVFGCADYAEDWNDKNKELTFHKYVKEFVRGKLGNHHLDFLPYGFIQQLIEWGFDVFGLLKAGRAINYNKYEIEEILSRISIKSF